MVLILTLQIQAQEQIILHILYQMEMVELIQDKLQLQLEAIVPL